MLRHERMPGSLSIALLAALHLLLLGWPSLAHASLGGSASSIESDRKAFQGKLARLNEAPEGDKKYTVQEITRDGMRIREYALPDGTIFAVTWHGPTPPDLSILLGKYYDEYREAVEATGIRRRSRTGRTIRSENVVTEHSGHMRDVRGKSYVPKLMPEGMTPEEITG